MSGYAILIQQFDTPLVNGRADARLRTISDADLIIVLQDGQVKEQGSHEELLTINGGVYSNLWAAQLSENTQVKEGEEEVEQAKVGVKDKS